MRLRKLGMLFGMVGGTVLGVANVTIAGVEYFDCLQHRVYGDTVISTMGTCSRRVPDPTSVPAPTPTVRGNAWLDDDANVRSGASFESGVMFQTDDRFRIQVHSWKGDWAWVTVYGHGRFQKDGWTHKVNIAID
jgi:hypothetical protein